MLRIDIHVAVRLVVMLFVWYKLWNFLITKETGGLWKRLIPDREPRPKMPQTPEVTNPVQQKRPDTGIVGKSNTVYLSAPPTQSVEPTMVIAMKPAAAADEEQPNAESSNISDDEEQLRKGLDREDRFTPFEEHPSDQEFSSGKTFEELSNVVSVLKNKEMTEEKRFEAAATLHGIGNTSFLQFVTTQIANSESVKKLLDEFPESDGELPKIKKSKIGKFDMSKYV